eukprot:3853752-Prymnesium_polylepis.1
MLLGEWRIVRGEHAAAREQPAGTAEEDLQLLFGGWHKRRAVVHDAGHEDETEVAVQDEGDRLENVQKSDELRRVLVVRRCDDPMRSAGRIGKHAGTWRRVGSPAGHGSRGHAGA